MGGGGVTLYSYNIINENPYNIYKIYASSIHATQHTKSTHNINTTNNHNSTLQPQQIDYIIFLDSDDYWKPYCIEECIKHSDGVDIVWFESECFLGNCVADDASLQHMCGFLHSAMQSRNDFIQSCKDNNVKNFWIVVCALINFSFLKRVQLTFYDGVIHEDHNFGLLLILQCRNIFVFCETLYCVRISSASTTRFDSKNPHIVPHCKHIYQAFNNARLAKQYHIASSWFLMLLELIQFLKDHPNKDNETIEQLFFPYYIQHSLKLFDFKHDPLNLVPKLSIIEPYLKKGFKYRHKLRITNPAQYNRLKPLFNIYDSIKGIERTIRKVFKKEKD